MNETKRVRDFMQACGQEVAKSVFEDNNKINTRLYLRLITEEYFELMSNVVPHTEDENLEELKNKLYSLCDYGEKYLTTDERILVADDLADISYVVNGLANVLGIRLDKVKKEVHASNMSKLNPHTGLADRDVNNKVIKGTNYFRPEIKNILLTSFFKV